MRTTIDLPDPLMKRAKACAAMRGIKLRRLFADALSLNFAEGEARALENGPDTGVPTARLEDLTPYEDPGALSAAYPGGYRFVGPLVKARSGASVLAGRAGGGGGAEHGLAPV